MALLEVEELVFNDPNKMQDYETHSIFRYFGKLPPTLVRKLLDSSLKDSKGKVLELMCGSGTTLLESYLTNRQAVGVDVNPLSVLVSKVKTTKIERHHLDVLVEIATHFVSTCGQNNDYGGYFRPKTRNLDYWFTKDIQQKLSNLKYFVDNFERFSETNLDGEIANLKDVLLVTYASIIRKSSNASPKTGRIFRVAEDNMVNPYELFLSKLRFTTEAIGNLPPRSFKQEVFLADARDTGLQDNEFDFILNHPPYFALYKYSSDVMRFELEWCDFDRKAIAKREIEDGFKTTNKELLFDYINDMTDVFSEARRLLKPTGELCVVVSDSTLREEQLPVIENLIIGAEKVGLRLDKHFVRKVSFAQASYHKSANPNIKTDEDHIMYFKK